MEEERPKKAKRGQSQLKTKVRILEEELEAVGRWEREEQKSFGGM